MEDMLFSEKSLKEKILSKSLRLLDPDLVKLPKRLLLLILEKLQEEIDI